MLQDECKYWCLTCQHSQGELCQSARSFPLHCHTTSSWWIKNELCRFVWVPKCCCQKAYADLRHSGKSTMTLNGKTTISAEQNLKIQLRIPKKIWTRVKRNKHSPILEKLTWEFIFTVFISKPFIWMHVFWCQMQNNLVSIHDNNTFSSVNTLCTGQLPCSWLRTPSNPVFWLQSESCLCPYKPYIMCRHCLLCWR